MSMIGNLSRISEDVRVALHKNPETIHELLYPGSSDSAVKAPGFFSRLFGKKPQPSAPAPEPLAALAATDATDIDKTWPALHLLFTDSAWDGEFPQGFLVSCGDYFEGGLDEVTRFVGEAAERELALLVYIN